MTSYELAVKMKKDLEIKQKEELQKQQEMLKEETELHRKYVGWVMEAYLSYGAHFKITIIGPEIHLGYIRTICTCRIMDYIDVSWVNSRWITVGTQDSLNNVIANIMKDYV